MIRAAIVAMALCAPAAQAFLACRVVTLSDRPPCAWSRPLLGRFSFRLGTAITYLIPSPAEPLHGVLGLKAAAADGGSRGKLQMFSAPGCPFCDQMRGMLCFAVEDVRSTLREVNVEDEAALQKESSAVQLAARAARTIPELWLVSADGTKEELIGDSEALNQLMSDGSLAQRLERFAIPHLLDDE